MTRAAIALVCGFVLGAFVGLLAPRPAASSTLAPPPNPPDLSGPVGHGLPGFRAGDQTRILAADPGARGRRLGSATSPAIGTGPALVEATPDPVSSGVTVSGVASWYCGGGSPCTRGTSPGDLVAAAGSELRDVGWGKGDRVLVTAGGRSVAVLLVDVCACAGERVIDLSRTAFARLADPSRGLVRVTVTALPTPPETDE